MNFKVGQLICRKEVWS